MEITDVRVFPIREEKLKAFVSIVLDDCFMINDVKIIRGRDGYFISMPSRRKKNGDFKDVAHPLNNDTRRKMEERILAEYDRVRGVRERSEPRAAAPAVEADEVASDGEDLATRRPAGEPAEDGTETTLEEVTDRHLSDSFWTT